jgi:hypothetical protein
MIADFYQQNILPGPPEVFVHVKSHELRDIEHGTQEDDLFGLSHRPKHESKHLFLVMDP